MKEEIIEFLVTLAESDPMILAKYAEDEDGGRQAFEEIVNSYFECDDDDDDTPCGICGGSASDCDGC